MPIRDGESCPGCGLPNYQGLCPHCTGDQALYEEELAPYFGSSLPQEEEPEDEQRYPRNKNNGPFAPF